MTLKLFDSYNLRARLCVSMFYVAPFLFDIVCLANKTFSITESVVLSAVCITICQAVLCLHRAPIKGSSDKNVAAELLYPSSNLSEGIRARYYRKLASFEPEFQSLLSYINPDIEDNVGQNSAAEKICEDVISWLRAKTRNSESFKLVHEENINYGYARNMFQLKKIGAIVNILAIISIVIYGRVSFENFIWNEHIRYCLGFAFHAISLLYLIFCVNKSSVEAAATRYARALLEAIDIL